MAITLIDGFDLYNGTGANTGLAAKWTLTNSGSTPVSLISGRFGGQAVRQSLGTQSAQTGTIRRSLSPSSSYSAAFAFRRSNLSESRPIFWLLSSSTYMVGLTSNSDGSLTAGRYTAIETSTALGTSATSIIAVDVWHYIEVEIVISDTIGEFRVKVDGNTVISLTGQDTRNGTPTTVDTVQFGVTRSSTGLACLFDFDDTYTTDTSSSLGERRVETLRPAADTAQKDFARSAGADNFALVDETTTNGDTDYVQGSTVGNLDRYSIGALSSTPSAISAVQLTAFALKTDAATRNIALHCRSGATDSDGPNYALAASYGKFDRILETDPATSAAWTSTGVNSLLIGPKVTV